MSRDFVSRFSRDFAKSPNRDRVARGGTTGRYSFMGWGNAAPVVSPIQHPPFFEPEYTFAINPTPGALEYNQLATPGPSLPFDVLETALNTNYQVDEYLRLRFLVTGVFETYPIATASPLQDGVSTGGAFPEFQYVDRPAAFTIRLSNGSFPAQTDAYTDISSTTGQTPLTDAWTIEAQGNRLVANVGEAGAGGIKTITTTFRIRTPGAFPVLAFTMGITHLRFYRPGLSPFFIHRRNMALLNPANPLVPAFQCIPLSLSSTQYFGNRTFTTEDCQWCWAKLVAIERTALTAHEPVQVTD